MPGPHSPLEHGPMLFVCGMSRSGTTLLTTVFDAHPRIVMGYELIPPPLPAPGVLRQHLDHGLHLCGGDFSRAGKVLRQEGQRDIGLFFTRCLRAGIDERQTREALELLQQRGLGAISSFEDRLTVAWQIARLRRDTADVDLFGFKLNIPSVDRAHELFPNGSFVFIHRDPRDVVASHRSRGFDRTLEQICAAWVNYVSRFQQFQQTHSDRAMMIAYEDLVQSPAVTLQSIFAMLPVQMDEAVLRFHEAGSQAAVHAGHHPNATQLKQSFFTSSVGRWRESLAPEEVSEIERACGGALSGPSLR